MSGTNLDNTARCQSCGMPLGEGFYGTTSEGLPELEYCKFCYQKGTFTEPNLGLEQMVKRSADHMVGENLAPPDQAETLARSTIPHLKRWRIS